MSSGPNLITIRGAREHNLKNIDLTLPRNALVVITGLSGSGKSSLAFDTLYAEGQRRYVESLSAYARQFLNLRGKPDVDVIHGLSPTIAIEQKTTSHNPRSTVGTVTEIYDYLRLLFARIGRPHCPRCGQPILSQTVHQMVTRIMTLPERTRFLLLAPVVRGRKGSHREMLATFTRKGFTRVLIDGNLCETAEPPIINPRTKHTLEVVVDRLILKPGIETRLTDSLEIALKLAEGLASVAFMDSDETILFSERHACMDCHYSYPEIEPGLFSFNNPHGACSSCDGLGIRIFFDPERVVPDPTKSLSEGALAPWSSPTTETAQATLQALARHYDFDLRAPWHLLPERIHRIILEGSGEESIRFERAASRLKTWMDQPWEGVLSQMERRYHETDSEEIRETLKTFQTVSDCTACQGARLNAQALSVRIGDLNIAQLTALPLRETLVFFDQLTITSQEQAIAQRVLKEIHSRIRFLHDVGLDYLALHRTTGTLSGGESQRIRLANQIGSGLTGVLYVLDEPSIGLHPRDTQRLLKTLIKLRDLGNTLVVIEHDAETILAADHIVDLGPGAGEAGGRIVAAGTPQEIVADPHSPTGAYLSGVRKIPIPEQRRIPDVCRQITLRGVATHNLRALDVTIPVGLLTCVTGVSGSGKSSLILDTLFPALARHLHNSRQPEGIYHAIEGLSAIDKVIHIDQAPIGRTPRSNPATYTGLFTPIRNLFAAVPEARARGYTPGRFSFNVRGGRCEACTGEGVIKIAMHFLPDVFVTCDACRGARYHPETLKIRYKHKTISEILAMTVKEALTLFNAVPPVYDRLRTLTDVGLGYIRLGQAATTLSGGEAQRIKIARELAKRATGQTLYILDEPTTGLHFADIQKLLEALQHLTRAGNTVVIIEHNMDVIKTADWILDLGPEGGDRGGALIAAGTPEQVARCRDSWTGRYLAEILP